MRNLEKARQESDFPIYPKRVNEQKMNVELLNTDRYGDLCWRIEDCFSQMD